MIDRPSELVDIAFAVCTVLDNAGVIGVLTGGSAATYYCPQSYQSLDVDFVLTITPQKSVIEGALRTIGFVPNAGGFYAHPQKKITVEFPRGPMAIGRDLVTTWETKRRADERLYVTSVTDCVRDRFLHFWAWNDRSALEVALTVASTHREEFDDDIFRSWCAAERAADRSYDEEKVELFSRRLAGM